MNSRGFAEREFYLQRGKLIRVLVIGNNDILSAGVASLFRHQDEFEVINQNVSDELELVSALDDIEPAALIISESKLCRVMTEGSGWLRDFPELRVIVLDERQNLLHVYQKQEVIVRGVPDLFNSVRPDRNRAR